MFARWFALVVAALLVAVTPARATLYTSIAAFGDSLTDDGNSLTTGGAGTSVLASNGPVAVQYLATRLGLGSPSTYFNYAVSGAMTAQGSNSVRDQVTYFKAHLPGGLDTDALYVLSGGANDLLDALSGGTVDWNALGLDIATNLSQAVSDLHQAGARHFLLPLLPDVALTPFAIQDPSMNDQDRSDLSAATLAINDVIASMYASLSLAGADITIFDLAASQKRIIDNASAYQLNNVTQTCPVGAMPTCDGYFYYDEVHPTTAVARLVADDLAAALGIPEPATLALVVGALIAGSWRLRSSQNRRMGSSVPALDRA